MTTILWQTLDFVTIMPIHDWSKTISDPYCIQFSPTFYPQIDFIAGTFLTPSEEERSKGFVGYNLDVLKANAWSDYRTENGKQMGFFR